MLHQDLSNLQLHRKSTLLQYVNDVLLSPVTKEASIEDSVYLLQQLRKDIVSKKKLQLSLDTISFYLGYNLSAVGIQQSARGIKLIQEFPGPTTKRQASWIHWSGLL